MLALEAVTAGASYILSALLLGVLVTVGFLLSRDAPKELRRSLMTAAVILFGLFLLVGVISLLIQGAKFGHGEMPSLEILFRYVTLTQSGKIWLLRQSYAAVLMLLSLWITRRNRSSIEQRIIFFLALPFAAGRSLTSHAVAVKDNTRLAVSADAVHVIATGLWGGGLLVLVWVIYRAMKSPGSSLSWAGRAIANFSRLALCSVAVLLLSGVYQSWLQVGTVSTLWSTDYGRVLALKIGIFLVMLALGAVNFMSTRPRLLRREQDASAQLGIVRTALVRIGAESALAVLVFFVTGLLTVLPPGVHSLHQVVLAKQSVNNGAPPALAPAEGAAVKILTPTVDQTFAGDKIPLRFAFTPGKRGHHVHAYVDGELMGMFESSAGTLNGIGPGRHTLELRVVAEDHQTELRVTDRTEFIVKGLTEVKQ